MAYQLIDTQTDRVLGTFSTKAEATKFQGRQVPEMNKYKIEKFTPAPAEEEAPAEEAPAEEVVAEEAPAEEAVVAEVADGEAESE